MNGKNLALGLATLALSIATASTAQASLINGVTVLTDMGAPDGNINNILNGVGLPGDTPSLTGTHLLGSNLNSWLGNPSGGNLITFNLNGQYSLAGFSLWNLTANNTFVVDGVNLGNNTFGVNGVNIFTSTDNNIFTALAGAPTQFAIGSSGVPEQFSFAPVTASYVRFQVLSNYGARYTGLSEVQFNSASTTAVPEPVTIFGTLMGLGGGAALKRRLRGVKSKSV
jgi:hypothetical protein